MKESEHRYFPMMFNLNKKNFCLFVSLAPKITLASACWEYVKVKQIALCRDICGWYFVGREWKRHCNEVNLGLCETLREVKFSLDHT